MLAFYSPDQSRVCTEQRCRYQDDFVGFEEFTQENGATSPRLAGRHVCVVTAYGVALASVLRWKHVAVIGFAYRRASEIEEQILRRFPVARTAPSLSCPPRMASRRTYPAERGYRVGVFSEMVFSEMVFGEMVIGEMHAAEAAALQQGPIPAIAIRRLPAADRRTRGCDLRRRCRRGPPAASTWSG